MILSAQAITSAVSGQEPPEPRDRRTGRGTITLSLNFTPMTVDIFGAAPTITISVTVDPVLDGLLINLLSSEGSDSGPWKMIAEGFTDNFGRLEASWKPPETGIFFLQAKFAGDAAFRPASVIASISLTAVPEFTSVMPLLALAACAAVFMHRKTVRTLS